MLGLREPEKYGHKTLVDIVDELSIKATAMGASLAHFQSNSESALIDRVHEAMGNVDAIIINPAAYTHTSVALRDALLSVSIPFIEIHLSNVHARENFRHHSYFSDIAAGIIVGFGAKGYELALEAAAGIVKQ